MPILLHKALTSLSDLYWARPVASLLTMASLAQAQQVALADSVHLQETVVTANRIEQPLSDLTADMTIIDSKTIERQGPGGVADLLARVPGIQMTS